MVRPTKSITTRTGHMSKNEIDAEYIGIIPKDFTKIFVRIKRETNMDELELQLFKERLKAFDSEIYDIMFYIKGSKFDDWITNTYKSLPKK